MFARFGRIVIAPSAAHSWSRTCTWVFLFVFLNVFLFVFLFVFFVSCCRFFVLAFAPTFQSQFVLYRVNLGSPRVGTDPEEFADDAFLYCRVQQLPVRRLCQNKP